MTQSANASELRAQLRAGLAACLAPAGWQPVADDGERSMTLAAFVHPLGDEFAAIAAEHTRALRMPDTPAGLGGFRERRVLALAGEVFDGGGDLADLFRL